MIGPLRILLLEDDPADARLVRETLKMDGITGAVSVVDTRLAFAAAVEAGDFDIVLADYRVPGFDGLQALALVRARFPEMPFIFVTGALGEDRAAETLKNGATDFVLKERLARLPLVVRRALDEAGEHVRRQQAEEALRESEERLRQLNAELEERVLSRTAQLRALAAELTQAEERERRRIAQILHDDLQQLLVAAGLHLDLACESEDAEVRQECLKKTSQLLNESAQISRELSHELSPQVLQTAGLVAALKWLGAWMREKHGLTVEVEAEAGRPPLAHAVELLLFQSVRELLFNVVKHSGVKQARVEVTQASSGQIEIRVSDGGKGFDPERVSAHEAGAGFGLFSIRQRLQLLGGSLEAESLAGSGSRFRLVAPLESTNQGEAAASPLPAPGTSGLHAASPPGVRSRIRVLVADDRTSLREGLVRLLREQQDIEVVAMVRDGEQAVELALKLQPDVALVDVSMPGLDGIEAARRIKAENPQISVIGLTIDSDSGRHKAMRQAGAVDCLETASPSHVLINAIYEAAHSSALHFSSRPGTGIAREGRDGKLSAEPSSPSGGTPLSRAWG